MTFPTDPSPSEDSLSSLPPPQPTPVSHKPRGIIIAYILLAIFILTLVPGPLFFVGVISPGPMKENKTVIIPKGTSVQEMASLLDQQGTLVHQLLFRAMARLMAEDRLKAGEYEIKPGFSVVDIVAMMREGRTVVRQFTAAEGLTSFEIVELLKQTPALTGEIAALPSEGSLLPETYRYNYGDTRQSVLDRMQKDARNLWNDLWAKREADTPLKSMKEAVILASIVEKETGKMAEERPKVAGVFLNRLAKHMPLQSDPTVIYALTEGRGPLGRSLTKNDLGTNSPFNTYVVPSLPPAPICNPGKAALEAVISPEKSEYLYFVANGTGGHAFARNLDDHNRNVAKWISLNRP